MFVRLLVVLHQMKLQIGFIITLNSYLLIVIGLVGLGYDWYIILQYQQSYLGLFEYIYHLLPSILTTTSVQSHNQFTTKQMHLSPLIGNDQPSTYQKTIV